MAFKEPYASVTEVPSRTRRGNYRPFSTNPWTLCLYLAALCACFGLLEYLTIQASPVETLHGQYRRHNRRGDEIAQGTTVSAPIYSQQITLTSSASTTKPTAPLEPYPGSQLTLTTSSICKECASAPPPKSQLTISSSQRTTLAVLSTASPTLAPFPTSQLTITSPTPSPSPVGAPIGSNQMALNGNFTTSDYFLVKYIPNLIAVVMASFWSITYAGLKLMAPFYQLASEDGASGKQSLSADYLSGGISLNSLTSGTVMLLASLIMILLSVCVSLASESMTVQATALCDGQPCSPVWVLQIPIVRVLQAIIAVTFFSLIVTTWLSARRRSGIFSDPSSLASIASLLGHEPVIEDIRNGSRGTYALGYFGQNYGIVKTTQAPTGYVPLSTQKPKKSKAIYLDLFLLMVTLGLLGLILAYKLVGESTSQFNRFMNSASFGPKFILSGSAVVVSHLFKRVERRVRIIEPYRRMYRQSQPANVISTSLASSPFTAIFLGLKRGQIFVAWSAFVAVLTELLVIAVAGVPFEADQIHLSYLASTWVSVAILVTMALSVIAIMFRSRWDPALPKDPDTIANIASYLHGSMVGRNGFEGKLFRLERRHDVDRAEKWMVQMSAT